MTNPTLSMKFYPPVGWTYPSDSATTDLSYLPGQSMTQTQAQNLANGALTAAVLEGLNSIGYPTSGITVTPSYTPPLVNDCEKTTSGTTAAGTQIGIVENGVVTQLATITASGGVTGANCIAKNYDTSGTSPPTYTPFVQQASVSIQGLVISEYQMNMVAAKIASVLNLNSGVQFTEEITVN